MLLDLTSLSIIVNPDIQPKSLLVVAAWAPVGGPIHAKHPPVLVGAGRATAQQVASRVWQDLDVRAYRLSGNLSQDVGETATFIVSSAYRMVPGSADGLMERVVRLVLIRLEDHYRLRIQIENNEGKATTENSTMILLREYDPTIRNPFTLEPDIHDVRRTAWDVLRDE